MRKIIGLMLCVMLILAMSVVTYAEEGDPATVEGETVQTENLPTVEENATEGENSVPEKTITETIVSYVQENFEEISVIGTLALSIIYEIRKHKKLNGSIGTLNNNAVSIAENSASAIEAALTEVHGIAEVVQGYKNEIALLLAEVRKNAEEKQALEDTLVHIETYLKTAKLANVEFANELAELLCLANIPNSKKDELYARHTKAVHDLDVAEEVMHSDGTEA